MVIAFLGPLRAQHRRLVAGDAVPASVLLQAALAERVLRHFRTVRISRQFSGTGPKSATTSSEDLLCQIDQRGRVLRAKDLERACDAVASFAPGQKPATEIDTGPMESMAAIEIAL